MQVSKLIGFLFLAMLVGVCFSLAPVSAGEHPWNDDQLVDTTFVTAQSADQNDEPEDPEDPGDPGDADTPTPTNDLLGNPLFFLKLIVDGPMITTGEDNSTPDIESTGTSDVPVSN